MTDEAPALIGIGAESLVGRAKALGLTWTLRPGSIVQAPGGTPTVDTRLLYDGDTVPIDYVNLTGIFQSIGRRVMGLIIPPAGNFVIGYVDSTLPVGVLGYGASKSSTGSISSETVFATVTGMIFRTGRAYRIRVSCSLDASTTGVSGAVRVRKSSTAGSLILGPRGYEVATNIGGLAYEQQGVVKNSTSSDIVTDVVATINCVSPNTVVVRGFSDNARELEIEDMGLGARFPGAVEIT